jgi:hypothetical protein
LLGKGFIEIGLAKLRGLKSTPGGYFD